MRYAASDTIQSLLPVVDDFERAIGAEGVTPEVKKGLELIHRRIFEVFSRAGLKEVSQHDTFDPNLHFAVDRAPAAEDQEDQQILDVYQKGYFFKGPPRAGFDGQGRDQGIGSLRRSRAGRHGGKTRLLRGARRRP